MTGDPSTTRDATPEETTVALRDRRLRRAFDRLGPNRLEDLDAIWDVCAEDLHGLALWRTGRRQDAEDALQDVFLRLAGAAERGSLSKVRQPFAYLLRMADRAALDILRSRRRHQARPLDELGAELVVAEEGLGAEARELNLRLATLPSAQRTVLYLRHFLGLSYREIGVTLRIPTFTAASRARLGLRRLRRAMGVSS